MMDLLEKSAQRRPVSRWAFWMPAIAIMVVTVLMSAWLINREFKQQYGQAVFRLESIAELRSAQVEAWVARQMSLAWYFDDSVALANFYKRWQQDGDAASGATLLRRLVEFRQAIEGDSVLVIDSSGAILAREHPSERAASNELLATLRAALLEGKAAHTSIYRGDEPQLPVRMDIVVPLLSTGPPVKGAFVLRVDPRRTLFPMLTSWPVPSPSAESVLWEREGDQVINISDTRQNNDSARRLIQPFATSQLPIAKVLRGEAAANTAIKARDYRGAEVLAVVRPVKGTDWSMVSKIDLDEVYGPARRNARWTVVAAALALLGVALATRLWRQRSIIEDGQRERIEQRQRLQTLALLEGITQSASDLIFAMDQQGRYVFFNRAAGEALGKSVDEIIGHTNAELFDEETAAQLTAHDQQALSATQPQVFEETIPTPQGELALLCTKGPLIGADGELLGIFGVARDVTETRKAELALRESEARHRDELAAQVSERTRELQDTNEALQRAARFNRALTDTIPGRVVYWDSNERCRFANRSFAEWFDKTPEDIIGKPLVEIDGDRFRNIVLPMFQAAMRGETLHFERKVQRGESGPVFFHQTHYIPETTESGDVCGVFVIGFDITELKLAEADLKKANEDLARSRDEAESATRAKSAFLANMSHEIRTPMNAIIGLTHLMTRDSRDPSQRERLTKVANAAKHLLQVINDILDLSKIEAGKLTLDDVEFQTETLLSRATEMVNTRARDKGLELILDMDHLPIRLRGDPVRLSQILINLLSNAVKFTEHGWVRLRAEVLAEEGRRLKLRFQVQDTGPGISQERQAALFHTFEQADNSSTRQHGGTGLGLSLSRQLAIAMGGDAGVISAPGAGSTFWFTVWLACGVEAAEQPAPVGTWGLRALVVDDLPEALHVIGSRLQMVGLEVDSVDGGLAALSKVEARMAEGKPYDVMFIDWRMEPLDGIATQQRLRALLGDGMPPSILVTAFDDPTMYEDARKVHFDAVILKPVTTSTVQDILARVLRQKAALIRPEAPPDGAQVEALLRQQHAGQRVLLAEDNPVNREVAEELLHSVGLVVETAQDGGRAVEMALSRPYDLILMDVQMPVMDGIEVTRIIRQRSGKSVPIIAMTANAFVEDRDSCLAAGMNDHVSKPVDPTLMYSTLLRWLPLIESPRTAGAAPTAPPVAEPSSRPPLHDRLAAIEGFDIARALRNVGGQESVLARVLLRFVDAYDHGLPILLDTSGDEHEGILKWRTVCHSVRGALSTIGASALVHAITDLERKLGSAGETASRAPFASHARQIHEGLLTLVRRMSTELKEGARGQ